MNEKIYLESTERNSRDHEIYRLRIVEGMDVACIIEKTGMSRRGVYRALSTFERVNPEQAEFMRKQGKEVTPEANKALLNEISRLKKELSQERLRADFYEEMVAFGKEFYGIDLKKAGTK